MSDDEFDIAIVRAAFELAAEVGWAGVSPGAAARHGALPLERARVRFPSTLAILMRFGQHADTAALNGALDSGPTRERLFDILMRRFDALQTHRAGILALLESLPADPATALALSLATARSMGWMLEAAGVPAAGWRGALATKGLTAVWLYTLRAWRGDDSADLSGTMAALDRALAQAERVAGWVQPGDAGPKPFPDVAAT